MASLEQLSTLGKAIMSAAVEAEMLELYGVRSYLDSAFDEVVVVARSVRAAEAELGPFRSLLEGVEVEVGS